MAAYTTSDCSNTASFTLGSANNVTSGNGTYTIGKAVPPGVGTYYVGASYTGDTNNNPASTGCGAVALVVKKATPTITWATPSAITYGAALSSTQLDATASTTSTFAYSPPSGTILSAGTHQVSVTFTPSDPTDYTSATDSVNIVVNQATTGITLTTAANPTTAGSSVLFTATVTGGPSVTGSVNFYENGNVVADVALGNGGAPANEATYSYAFPTVGTFPITAEYTGDGNNLASPEAPTINEVVNKAPTTITVTSNNNPSGLAKSVTFTAT